MLLELRARDNTAVTTGQAHGTEPWKRFAVTWEGAKEAQEVLSGDEIRLGRLDYICRQLI